MANGKVKREAQDSPGLSYKSSAIAKTNDENRRIARSGAPSVATRDEVDRKHILPPVDEDDDCIFMEKRPRPNLQPNENVSFLSNPGFQAIGQKLKEVNDTLGTLQSLGIQKVASLPELVLVGDQSAGKSSIMSAIAGLNLPHNTGVCTRCPVHIRLSRSLDSDWSLSITLQQDYAFKPSGDARSQKHVTKQNPFPPWVKQNRETKEFIRTRGKPDCLENVLRWAQVAILNHNDDHELYARKALPLCGSDSDTQDEDEAANALARAESETQAKFSPNVVALVIKGPDLPELSFYDLPGVFANARHEEDQYLSDVVKNLTREYISHDKAIILWAVPMNTDAETSTTNSLIREMNAVERCLGIMTKADLLPRGGHSQWLEMLNGLSHRCGLGYFITSRPDKDLDEQEAFEEAFFNRQARHGSHTETPTWPQEFADFDERCGVVRLKAFLSQKLAEDFGRSLPAVKAVLEQRLAEVVSELEGLPELPDNPELEIRKALLEFTTLARTCLKEQEFLGSWRGLEKEFNDAILGKKPKYIVKAPTVVVIDLDSDATPSQTPKRSSTASHYADPQSTPSKRRALQATATPSGTPRHGATVKLEVSSGSTPASLRLRSAVAATQACRPQKPKVRSLEELRAIIESKRQPGMPNSTPDSVFESLCVESVQFWHNEIQHFVGKTMRLVHVEMLKALDTAFATLKKRTAYREAKVHLNAFLKSHHEKLCQQLSDVYELERHQLYTNNHKFFELNKEKELRELIRHRHYYRWIAYSGVESSERPRPYDSLTDEEKAQEATRMAKEAPKMGKDPLYQELEVASYVRAYYITAATRFIDNASLHMVSGMFPTVAKAIQQHLDEKLGLMNQPTREMFDRLMEEEPKIAELRNQLKDDRKKFDEAMASIFALESGKAAPDDGDVDEVDYLDMDGREPAMMSGALNGSAMYDDDI